MTEFEIGEALTSNMGIVLEALSIYLTITSAYLVVAYLVGDKLARSQVVVVSTVWRQLSWPVWRQLGWPVRFLTPA